MAYEELKALGRQRLDSFLEVGLGCELWSVQRKIAVALSKPRAKVAVPSCNASGKTYLAAALAVAFYSCFDDSKVIVTSSKEDQLKNALFAELRRHVANARVPIPGTLSPKAPRMDEHENHFIVGHTTNSREGFQGLHAPHKLIIADEATAVDDELASGINALLSAGDARILIIMNPTSSDTWAAEMCRSEDFEVIRIRAWDTPAFTGEPMPEGATLLTPEWLEDMKKQGMGPGSVEWTTRVEANFWESSETQLILPLWYEKALQVPRQDGSLIYGIDLAPYGDAENVIAHREGNALSKLEVFPSMRPDLFWQGSVFPRAHEQKPKIGIYDADGVGAGSIGDAESALGRDVALPFRGGTPVGPSHRNLRSLWWWQLRRALQNEEIHIAPEADDPKLKKQLVSIQYSFTETGAIKIESKENMRRRGVESPDRADAMMYAFSIEPLPPKIQKSHPFSDEAMWERIPQELAAKNENPVHPVLGVRDW